MRDSVKTVRMQREFERLYAWNGPTDCGVACTERKRAYGVSGHRPAFYGPVTPANPRYERDSVLRVSELQQRITRSGLPAADVCLGSWALEDSAAASLPAFDGGEPATLRAPSLALPPGWGEEMIVGRSE